MLRLPKYKYLLLLLDIFTINLSFFLSAAFSRIDMKPIPLTILNLVIFSFLLVFIFQWNGLYKINVFSTRVPQFIRLIRSLFIGLSIYLIIVFLLGYGLIYKSRLMLIFLVASLFILLILYRIVILPFVLKRLMNSKALRRRCVIIGAGKLGRKILSDITLKPELGLEVVGFLDDNIMSGTQILNNHKVLGGVDKVSEVCEKYNLNEIIIGIDNITHERLFEIISEAKKTGRTVRLISSIFKVIPNKLLSETYLNYPTVTLTRGMYSNIFLVQKRVVDLIGSLLLLILLIPFFLLIAILIKISSKGPVFYKQERVGKDGKIFKMYKFRTMYVDADKDQRRVEIMKKFIQTGQHPDGEVKNKKIVDRNKITPIGRILRKFSIDELPQLINVVKGEMSLVGPRPVLPYEYKSFKSWHHERDRVLPGCTGFWQVYGRSETNFDDMVLMDIYYIQNMSPWLDIQIILKTIPVMLLGKGGG